MKNQITLLAERMKQKLTERVVEELSGLDQFIRPLGPLIARCEVAKQFVSAIHTHGRQVTIGE